MLYYVKLYTEKRETDLDKKTTDIVAYLTWIGLLIAIFLGDREGSKFHINQALVIWIAGLLIAIFLGDREGS